MKNVLKGAAILAFIIRNSSIIHSIIGVYLPKIMQELCIISELCKNCVEYQSRRVLRSHQIQPFHFHFSQMGSREDDVFPNLTHLKDQRQIDSMLSDLQCRLCFTVQMEDSSLLVPLSEVDLIFSKFCSLVNSVGSHGETEMINDDIYFALTILMHSNLLNSWFYCFNEHIHFCCNECIHFI